PSWRLRVDPSAGRHEPTARDLTLQPAFVSRRAKARAPAGSMTRSAGMNVLAAVIVIGAGYFLQLGLGRAVVPAEFAFFQETLAVYMMAMLPLQPIAAVVTKQSALHQDRLWNDVTRPSLIAIPLLATIAIFVSAGRGTALGWDATTVLMFAFSVLTGVAFLITNSLAIGRLDFVGSTIVQTIQALLRVAF